MNTFLPHILLPHTKISHIKREQASRELRTDETRKWKEMNPQEDFSVWKLLRCFSLFPSDSEDFVCDLKEIVQTSLSLTDINDKCFKVDCRTFIRRHRTYSSAQTRWARRRNLAYKCRIKKKRDKSLCVWMTINIIRCWASLSLHTLLFRPHHHITYPPSARSLTQFT